MHKIRRFARQLALVTFGLPLLGMAAVPQPTHEFTLDNGLKVVVREDHRAPVVVSQLWYKVGSSYEAPGLTGLSHALEHMMFKGTAKLAPGEGSRLLRELGAEENAFTSDDYTAYYQVLAKDRLEVAFELESDRLSSLTLPEDEFVRELEVIKEERRMRTDDKPNALAFERFKSIAYPASGYRNPTIGWMSDLERMTIADLRQWHNRYYAPNNATMVVVGDVSVDEVKRLANKHFAHIAKGTIPEAKAPVELAEPGERRLTLSVKTQLPSLYMGFNVPSLTQAKDAKLIHALRLASALLDGGYSSRLAKHLEREQELVASASSWYSAYTRGDSLFMLSATPNVQTGKTLEEVEAGLWAELEKLKNTQATDEELARVRAQVLASTLYERDSIANQATAIGQAESIGLSWRLLDQDPEALKAVTAADIQAAAKAFFTRERVTIAYVLPKEQDHE